MIDPGTSESPVKKHNNFIAKTLKRNVFMLMGAGVVVFFALLVGIAVVMTNDMGDLQNTQQSLQTYSLHFAFIRVGLFALLMWRWTPIVSYYERKGKITEEVSKKLKSSRKNIILWAIIFELFIVQNIIAKAFL